ncbi:MAG TPA: GAF and ANTAR domain-containing protein, partial [Acidimicrobiia bacterium]|nr:GAF and ANTAR domain-containing protein [Acidimicrobiia bacterium]
MKTREQRLAEIFIGLADTLVTDFDVTDLFYHLVDACTEVVEADHAGLLLTDSSGTLQVVAATSETAQIVELLELKNLEGPCWDAFQSGNAVVAGVIDSPEARARWPVFSEAALDAGIRSAAAVPMRLRAETLGALNLFRSQEGDLSDLEVATARTLADIASIAILQDRAARDAQTVIDQLQGALDSRVVIEQARGVIAEHSGLAMDQAFSALRRYARDQNARLRVVAEDVVARQLDPAVITS